VSCSAVEAPVHPKITKSHEGFIQMIKDLLHGRPARVLALGAAAASILVLAACGSSGGGNTGNAGTTGAGNSASSGDTATANLGLLSAGTVKVGFMNGLMPYVGLKGGALTGVDGDLFTHAVQPLGLKVDAQGSEFSAMIAGIQAGRLDIGIGGIAWTAAREKVGVYTDPVYYSPLVMLTKPGLTLKTVDDLKGKKIGAPTATLNLQAAQAAGADAKAYPDWNKTLADLESGRLDAASVDPLVVVDAQKNVPALKNFSVDVIQQPTADQLAANPALSAFNEYEVAWYCSPKAKNLCAALSTQIDKMYSDGSSKQILTTWGVDADKFLTSIPAMSAERAGVDRPAGWTAPTISQ
jgi:ABC-type amino acid transport substrate-binding protein